MTEVTQILSQIEEGDPSAADQLLPLVYEELRRLAIAKLANEKPGQTLEESASALSINVRTAHRYWSYARAWLHDEIRSTS